MKISILVSLCSLALYSCYSPRYVYTPSIHNIPSLNRKNDVQVAAFYSGFAGILTKNDRYNNGFDIHAAWAISNHFAAMINESLHYEKNSANDSFLAADSSLLSYKSNTTEFAAGYFTAGKRNKRIQLQVFGGMATGTSKIYDDFISNSIHQEKYHYSKVTRFFIQPALLYSPFKILSTALSSRFTGATFSHIRTNYSAEELNNYILDSLTVSPVFFWEPAVNYTFSLKNFPFRLEVQGSLTILINHRFVEHRNANFGLGITYNFPNKKK